jgi:hypothetical protein
MRVRVLASGLGYTDTQPACRLCAKTHPLWPSC